MNEALLDYIIRKVDEKYTELTNEKTRLRTPRETAISAVKVIVEQLQDKGVVEALTDLGTKDTPGIRFVAVDASEAIQVRCIEAKPSYNRQADLEYSFRLSTAQRNVECVAGVTDGALMTSSPVLEHLIALIAETKAADF